MYNPTHTRMGPFFVGGFLACSVYISRQYPLKTSQYHWFHQCIAWISTGFALIFLIIPCLPAEDTAPMEAQLFATATLRILVSIAGSILLYRCLVPQLHDWYWRGLSDFLSLNIFHPFSKLTYCSYLLHFRIILELNFTKQYHEYIINFPGNPFNDIYINYMPKLFILTLIISLLLSIVLHYVIEVPTMKFMNNLFKNNQQSKLIKNK